MPQPEDQAAAKAARTADREARKQEQKHPAGIDAPDPVLEPGETPPVLPTAEEYQEQQAQDAQSS